MLNILRDLFANCAIIIASISFGNLIIRDAFPQKNARYKILISILWGVLGCILMIFSVRGASPLIIDFRSIPIMIMGIYGSFGTTMITTSIIALFRFAFFGFNQASIIGFGVIVFTGLACGFVGLLKINTKVKWALCTLLASAMFSISPVLLIHESVLLADVMIAYYVGMIMMSLLTYVLMTYIRLSNERYIQLKNASNIDYLTGLNNVRHFDNTINAYQKEAGEKRKSVSLLFIDIDYFKKVNDTYGHLSGDLVLKQIAELLMKFSRGMDVVTRKGGEEFTVLLLDCGLTEAGNVAERIRKSVQEQEFVIHNGTRIHITVSIGVSSCPETALEQDKLIEQADIALYKAKRAGRNAVSIADAIVHPAE